MFQIVKEVMTEYKNDPGFLESKQLEKQFANEVKTLSSYLDKSLGKEQQLFILKELAYAINKFDDQVRQTINNFPEYYNEHQENLDPVLDANSNFLYQTLEKASSIKGSKAN